MSEASAARPGAQHQEGIGMSAVRFQAGSRMVNPLLYYRLMERSWNQQLPRGRHHLSREEVSQSQRRRILTALLEEVAVRGYAATSVAHITASAGVSRKSFYEQFADKEDCYFAAFEMAGDALEATLRRSVGGIRSVDDPVEYFRTILRSFLNAVAASPAASRTLLVEIYAVGPEAVRHKAGRHHVLLAAFLGPLGFTDPDGALTFEGRAIAGSIFSMMTMLVAEGRTDEVPSLCDPLVDWVARHRNCVAVPRTPAEDDPARV
jgi:AcrR family transcriptional regulator